MEFGVKERGFMSLTQPCISVPKIDMYLLHVDQGDITLLH